MPETAWAFHVVSSDAQAATLEEQERWTATIAAANGWPILRTFRGVSSGAKGTRELLADLLADLRRIPKGSRPARVLMVRLDRVGRQALDCIAAVAELRRLGVTLHTQAEGDLQLATAMDSLRPIFALVTAEMENDVRSQKWKAVHARRRAAGLHVGVVPFGVVLLDGKAVPYEPEATIVRELFAKAEAGWGYSRLARWAKENAPTKRLADGDSRRMAWAPSTVKSLLRGKTVRQIVTDPETYRRVDASFGSQRRVRAPSRWPWPLNGAIRCTCGKPLVGHCSGAEPYRVRYYICRYHASRPLPAHRADALEASFRAILDRFTASPDLIVTRKGGTDGLRSRAAAAQKRLEALDRRRRRAWEVAEEGALSGADLGARLAEIDAERTRTIAECYTLRAELSEREAFRERSSTLKAMLVGLADRWASSPVELQQMAAAAVASLLGGLYAEPEARGALILGAEARKADASGQNAPRALERLLSALG